MSPTGPEDPKLASEVKRAVQDFERRTLDPMQGYYCRLIYLASLRDYNTGRYHHYGLEVRFAAEAVDEALRRCHARVFEELLALPLEAQVQDLIRFFESLREEKARLVETWQRLRSYQILAPQECHPLARDLFTKNIEIVLKLLRETDLWPLLNESHGDPDNLP